MAELGAFVGAIVVLSILLALAIPILIIWAIVMVIRSVAGGPGRRGPYWDPAVEQLRYRLVRGEITQAQFEQAMWNLGYEKVP